MSDDPKLPATNNREVALDVASVIVSTVPWIGGPVSNVLSGISVGRKVGRVREVLDGVAEDLRNFKSEVSERYVKTEDFEELLEQTLRKAMDERSPDKRSAYRLFLTETVKSAPKDFDDHLRIVRTLEQLGVEHLIVLRAFMAPPENAGAFGSILGTLKRRAPNISEPRIEEIVSDLNRLGVTESGGIKVVMTAHGSQELRNRLTSFGRRFARFVIDPHWTVT